MELKKKQPEVKSEEIFGQEKKNKLEQDYRLWPYNARPNEFFSYPPCLVGCLILINLNSC